MVMLIVTVVFSIFIIVFVVLVIAIFMDVVNSVIVNAFVIVAIVVQTLVFLIEIQKWGSKPLEFSNNIIRAHVRWGMTQTTIKI